MALIAYSIILITSFYLLAEVSDKYFVVSLDKIAEKFKMSHEMAGATLMAIGSSAPELFVAIIALVRSGDHAEIGVGTIVGSALFNILVIIGASAAVIQKAKLVWQPVFRDLLFYTIAIALLYYVLHDGKIELLESIVLVLFYGFYLIAVMYWRKLFTFPDFDSIDDNDVEEDDSKNGWRIIFVPLDYILSRFFPSPKHYVITFIISIGAIAVLCWILVETAIGVSRILNVPEVIIALTVLAIGTSIPDMISSVIVAKQGRGGMAVSNAVGSNIFDIFIGLGLPWLIIIGFTDVPVVTAVEDLRTSVFLLFASVIFLFIVLTLTKWKIGRPLGYFLISLYVLYLVWEITKLYIE